MNSPEDSAPVSPHPHEHGEDRPDLSSTHVTHVREDVAMAGRCANVHLPTGRTCTLPERHSGSCAFVEPEDAQGVAVH
ncbi:hypothetical protein [Pseudarthrobacter sp. S9]|uniref:hypothetical protein n=1 Tax=Pseudarthrobacter sp. S9 TaxID=3418421 RepID=UPI003D044B6D